MGQDFSTACIVAVAGFLCCLSTQAVAQDLPALPDVLPVSRVALRVVAPDGKPIGIADIALITVYIEPDAAWRMGPKPTIDQRYADGWVSVDVSMYALGKPGMKTEITFKADNGTAISATATLQEKDDDRVEYRADADPRDAGINLADGPADVAADEVAGRVLDSEGKPVAGAIVRFPDGFEGLDVKWKRPPLREPVTTDADGVFRFADFAHQHYIYLQVEKDGFAKRWITDLPTGTGFSVRLDSTTRAVGNLKRLDGSPAADATIKFVTSRLTTRPNMGNPISDITLIAKSDANGHYDVPLEPGEYDVIVLAPGEESLRVRNWKLTSHQSGALPTTLNAGHAVSLRVIDDLTGKPVPDIQFAFSERRPGVGYVDEKTLRKSDAQGNVTWTHVREGPAEINVSAPGYTQWWIDRPPTSADAYSARIHDLYLEVGRASEPLTVRLKPGVTVVGTVLMPDGKPLADAPVNIAGLSTGDARYMKQTDANGRFEIVFPNIQYGHDDDREKSYSIVVLDPQGRFTNAVSQPLKANAGDRNEIALTMSAGPRVRGTVRDPDGNPVPRIEVEAVCDDDLDAWYFNPRALTDENGEFDLGPMRPGRYKVQADINFGVNISHEPPQPTVDLDLKKGDASRDIDVLYSGPTPPPVPQWYYQSLGNRKVAKE